MKKRCVKIYGINDAIELVDVANKVDGNITLSRGKYAIDAKNILGVMAINTSSEVVVEYPVSATEFDEFIAKFEVMKIKNE